MTRKLAHMPPLRLRGQAAEIGAAVDAVRRFALAEGLAAVAADALVVAVDEAISNILLHAYDALAEPAVTIEATADCQAIEVVLVDDGRPFNPLEQLPPALEGGAADRPVGGLGIHIMRSLVDGLEYCRDGTANRLVLRKRRIAPLAAKGAGSEDGPDSAGA